MTIRIVISSVVALGLLVGCADKPVAAPAPPPPPPATEVVAPQEPQPSAQEAAERRAQEEQARRRAEERRAQQQAQREAYEAARRRAEAERREREARERANDRAGSSMQPPASSGFNEPKKEFPWPPAKPSSFTQVPTDLFGLRPNQVSALGALDMAIRRSLAKGGYYDASYYSIPGQPNAFALVTRLEKYNLDGSAVAREERWVAKLSRQSSFSLGSYLKSLFFAEQGNYRVIVFVVTAQDIKQWSKPIQARVAKDWIAKGGPSLPSRIQRQPLSPAHKVFALIYEFEKNCDDCENIDTAIVQTIPGRLQTKEHLSMTSVWE